MVIIFSSQVRPQFLQVLEVTLTDMVSQNCQKYVLVVCAVCNLLDKVNMTVFRSLGTEILRPAKQDKFPNAGFFSTSLIRSLIALALSECFEAYALIISSLTVIIPDASLSKGGTNPSCTKYDII